MSLILQHYWELLLRHRRLVLLLVAIATAGTALVSVVLLYIRPAYTSEARVIMLPTDAEVAFAQGRVDSSRTAQLLTETHLEYLMSRTVARSVLDRARQAAAERATEETGLTEVLKSVVNGVLGFISRTYRILNSGIYVEPTPEERALAALRHGTTVSAIPGSYIMEIAVELPNPEAAAFAANALAEAYVARVTEELEKSAGEMGGFVSQETTRVEADLARVVAQELQLREELGLQNLEEDIQKLSDTREAERRASSEAQVEVRELQSEVAQLRAQRKQANRATIIARLDEEIPLKEAQLGAVEAGLKERARTIARLDAELNRLQREEEPVRGLKQQRESLEGSLGDLRQRAMDVQLSRSSALNRVRVIDPAVVPVYPSFPLVLNNTVLGLLAGIVLALGLLVAIDTFTGAIKTTVDLRRLAGGRALGRLDGRLVGYATDSVKASEKLTGRLRELGAELERRLAAEGGMDAPALQVTGFLEPGELADATATLALALAGHGREVVCSLPESVYRAYSSAAFAHMNGNLRFVAGAPAAAPGRVSIVGLPPVSGSFRYGDVARRSPALVCILPAGSISPEEVEDFQSRAAAGGLSPVTFLLLDA